MRKLIRLVLGVAIVGGACAMLVDEAAARGPARMRSQGLFNNLYSDGPATPAQLYPAPMPVPEWVGHTYVTYQPLMSQEWLNPHARRYFGSNGRFALPHNYTRVEHW